jgi:hypothetical protein
VNVPNRAASVRRSIARKKLVIVPESRPFFIAASAAIKKRTLKTRKITETVSKGVRVMTNQYSAMLS